MSGSGTLSSGVSMRFHSVLTWQGIPEDRVGRGLGTGGINDGSTSFHRYMIDENARTWFGYDLAVEVRPRGELVATFKPPTGLENFVSAMLDGRGKQVPLAKFPGPQTIHDGDWIEVDLMVSPDSRQKLTDHLQIFGAQPGPFFDLIPADLKDFTLDDGPVTFDSSFTSVFVKGKKANGQSFTGKPGATFWIYIPGEGRYVFSLTHPVGWRRMGAVRGNNVLFGGRGDDYVVWFMSPIAGKDKAWNLYGRRDATWKPEKHPELIAMGTDRLESLTPQVGR
jgi:hypothetical protein